MIARILGVLLLILAVIGGFMVMGGSPKSLWHPSELIVIWGSALATFLISSNEFILKRSLVYALKFFGAGRASKKLYYQLVVLILELSKIGRSQGMLALDKELENPGSSQVIQRYELIAKDPQLVQFIAKNMVLIGMLPLKTFHYKEFLEDQIYRITESNMQVPKLMSKVSDWLPGFGIMAAIMGVILTMKLIGGEVSLVGEAIGAALVGTFVGILTAFGIVAPSAHVVENMIEEDQLILETAAIGLNAYAEGNSPGLIVEILKQQIPPGYYDEALDDL